MIMIDNDDCFSSYNTWCFCVLFFLPSFCPIKDVQLGFYSKIIGCFTSSSPHQLRVPLMLTWRIPQKTPVWDTSSSQLGQGGNSMKQQHNNEFILSSKTLPSSIADKPHVGQVGRSGVHLLLPHSASKPQHWDDDKWSTRDGDFFVWKNMFFS